MLKHHPIEVMVELYRDYKKEFHEQPKTFGGEEADSLDCFQDAMIAFYNKVVNEKSISSQVV